MITSGAKHATFVFAQNTETGMCHISFDCDGEAINLQINQSQVWDMSHRLLHVLRFNSEKVRTSGQGVPLAETEVSGVGR